jgi:hypothetical protein
MRKFLFFASAALIVCFGAVSVHPFAAQEQPPAAPAAGSADKTPQEAIDRKNPVKPTPEGLASARRQYSYDCAMCHGPNGDGKGDLVESMKLTLHDWRDPSSIADKTDGELFYIITQGRGKMVSEKGRASDTLCWELVNLVRSFAKKAATDKPAS